MVDNGDDGILEVVNSLLKQQEQEQQQLLLLQLESSLQYRYEQPTRECLHFHIKAYEGIYMYSIFTHFI